MSEIAERLGALPIGELHAENVCARCGYRGREDVSLYRTVLASTLAIAHVCVDSVRCERRRYDRKRIS